MSGSKLQKKMQGQAYSLVAWQLIGVFLIAILGLILSGWKTGLGILGGGFAYGLPNLYFVWRVFRYTGAQQMTQFAAAFFRNEFVKLFFSGILFILVVKTCPVSLLSVLVGFAGAILAFWIVCIWQFSI
jgi:ATP synthase protein I